MSTIIHHKMYRLYRAKEFMAIHYLVQSLKQQKEVNLAMRDNMLETRIHFHFGVLKVASKGL